MMRPTNKTSWLKLLGEDRAEVGAAILRWSRLAAAAHLQESTGPANGLAGLADRTLVNVACRDPSAHREVRR